jgi:hypothetical protein
LDVHYRRKFFRGRLKCFFCYLGDVDELKNHLEEDQIQYALVRLGGIQEEGTLKVTIRDVFITWIGPGVGIIEKGKKAAYQGDAQVDI